MSDALRKGVSQFVDDFVGGGIPESPTPQSVQTTSSTTPPSPRQQKRIHMPANFPGYTPSLGNTPLATPQVPQIPRRTSTHPPSHISEDYANADRSTSNASSTRISQVAPSNTGSSHFRFRGQFASQPGTPGIGVEPGYEQRRLGMLNAR